MIKKTCLSGKVETDAQQRRARFRRTGQTGCDNGMHQFVGVLGWSEDSFDGGGILGRGTVQAYMDGWTSPKPQDIDSH